jgi:rhamnogalacturonyl hydrolase YesR
MDTNKRIFPVLHLIGLLVIICLSTVRLVGQNKENFAKAVGRSVVENLLSRQELMMYRSDFLNTVHYAEACAGMGAVRVASILNDTVLLTQLELRYRQLFEHFDTLPANHVDANVIGILPLALYQWNKKEEYKNMGVLMADIQWENPQSDGLTNQTRYWIDDIFMIGSLQVEAFKATGDTIFLVRAAKEISAYLKRLQQPNGLFYHGPEAPFFWGRGNGWVAAGLAELLSVLPQSNPDYFFIKEGYLTMMESLLGYQSKSGMWRQLVDREEAWEESSCTAMFGYAMSVGVKKGLLDSRKYRNAIDRTWVALVDHLDEKGNLTDICVGTGQRNEASYYLARPKVSGDLHGQAPLLWFAAIRLAEK